MNEPIDPRLDELLDRWETARERGETLSPETLCQDCPELREPLRTAIAQLQEIESLASPHHEPPSRSEGLPPRIGPYEVIDRISVRSSAAVYRCRQRTLQRDIAVKVFNPFHFTEAAKKRFLRESRIIASLHHPAIVQAIDSGTCSLDGRVVPYYAMHFINGQPLDEYLKACEPPPTLEERLLMFLKICDPLTYAHDRGVVHRDLKPSNILIDEFDRPHVLDFGLARWLKKDVDTITRQSDAAEILGTVAYMSPEQAAGKQAHQHSDIYSLGVILYEMLSGSLPIDVSDDRVAAAIVSIRDEPLRPLSAHDSRFAGDLETIVDKTLEKEPQLRYQSVAELAQDVRSYLDHRPIAARPVGRTVRLQRWTRRNPWLAASLVALMLALACGTVVSSIFAYRSAARARHIDELRAVAERSLAESQRATYSLALQQGFQRAPWQPDATIRSLLDEKVTPRFLRDFTWRLVLDTARQARRIRECENGLVYDVRFFHDHDRFITSHHRGKLEIWHAPTAERLDVLSCPEVSSVWTCASSPDDTLVAAGTESGNIHVLRADNGKLVKTLTGHEASVHSVRFHVNGKWVVSVNQAGIAMVHDFRSGDVVSRVDLETGPTELVRVSDSGRRVIGIRGDDNVVHQYKIWLGPTLRRFPLKPGHFIDLTTYADRKLYLTETRGVRVIDIRDGTELHRFQIDAPIEETAASSRGLAIRTRGPRIMWLFREERTAFSMLDSGGAALRTLGFSSPGRWLIAADNAERISIWDFRTGLHPRSLEHDNEVMSLCLIPNTTFLVTGTASGNLELWNHSTGEHVDTLYVGRAPVNGIAASADGRLLACRLLRDNKVYVLEWGSNKPHIELDAPGSPIQHMCFLGDSNSLMSSGLNTARIWNVADRRPVHVLPTLEVRSAATNTDASVVAVGDKHGSITLFRSSDWTKITEWHAHVDRVIGLEFHPDGHQLVSASHDRTAIVWDLSDQQPLAKLGPHQRRVTCVAFSPDGRTVVTGDRSDTIRLWDPVTGNERLGLGVHIVRVRDVAFSEDGHTLFSAGHFNKVMMWHAPPFTSVPMASRNLAE